MPSKKWINKSTATTYQLVHRPQADPLSHDTSAPPTLFQEVSAPQARKVRTRRELETELFGHENPDGASSVGDDGAAAVVGLRKNEGEAATWGVYYDDSEYDYMQHLRELGGEGVFVDAEAERTTSREKGKTKGLAEALKAATLETVTSGEKPLLRDDTKLHDAEILPSTLPHAPLSYQAQQDVPDVLAGFQPDMDPRLREVLAALEDEAYVDDGEEGEEGWRELVGGHEELDMEEWKTTGLESYDDHEGLDDEDWESDDTERPAAEYRNADAGLHHRFSEMAIENESTTLTVPTSSTTTNTTTTDNKAPQVANDCQDDSSIDRTKDATTSLKHDTTIKLNSDLTTDFDPNTSINPSTSWLEEYGKYKQASSRVSRAAPPALSSALLSGMSSLASGRHKKRKGARTSDSTYSMTSASVARSDGLQLLDRRFERIEELYATDDDDDDDDRNDEAASVLSAYSGLSGVSATDSKVSGTSSQAPELRRKDFEDVMDAFLAETGGAGRRGRRGRRGGGGGQNGLEQLDEIRRELGPPRLRVVGGG